MVRKWPGNYGAVGLLLLPFAVHSPSLTAWIIKTSEKRKDNIASGKKPEQQKRQMEKNKSQGACTHTHTHMHKHTCIEGRREGDSKFCIHTCTKWNISFLR